jgi:hypothetical protein
LSSFAHELWKDLLGVICSMFAYNCWGCWPTDATSTSPLQQGNYSKTTLLLFDVRGFHGNLHENLRHWPAEVWFAAL